MIRRKRGLYQNRVSGQQQDCTLRAPMLYLLTGHTRWHTLAFDTAP